MKHLASPRLLRRLQPLITPLTQLVLPALLSAAQLSGGYAPFALAAVAVSGPKLPGLLALAGTGAGALLFLDFQAGLRQFGAAVLMFAVNTALYDSRLYRRPAFRPAMAVFVMLLVQSIYLIHRSTRQWMLCLAAAAVLAGGVWCWRTLWSKADKNAVFVLLAAAAVAAQPVALLGDISLGRLIASAVLLWIAADEPPERCVSWGAAIGLLLDMSGSGSGVLLGAIYGCGAALASLCRFWPRAALSAAFCLTVWVAAVLFRADIPAALLYEAILASGGFYLLRRRAKPARLASPAAAEPSALEEPHLKRSAAALRELYDSFFRGAPSPAPENPAVLFDRAAEQVCRGCVLCGNCWHQNYNSTYNAFNDACPHMLRRGQAVAQDFPSYFSSRCVRFGDFLTAVNGELHTYLLRRQYRQRLVDIRREAQEQYQQLGEALASSTVHAVSNVSAPMGYRIGSTLWPKEGETLCGDHFSVFEVGPVLYLLLSDGMGSGETAHRESALTVRLLQQFLQAGIEPAPALKTLNSALRLRGDDVGSFTTIDLLALHRSSGTATVYKYGAAPSYIKRTGAVSRITGQSLPAGLQKEPPEATRLSLLPDSYFVMISDGVADETNDEWLQDLLAGWRGNDVNALVSLILRESESRKGTDDDRAILILQLSGEGNKKRQV